VHNKFGDLCETQHAAVKHKWNQFVVARLQRAPLDCLQDWVHWCVQIIL